MEVGTAVRRVPVNEEKASDGKKTNVSICVRKSGIRERERCEKRGRPYIYPMNGWRACLEMLSKGHSRRGE